MAAWQLLILVILTWAAFLLSLCDAAHQCSWSNEGCAEDSECCSHSCHRAHEGTNARCRHSTLGGKCVFDYHCQDGLTCGPHFNCCSPYWKMCIKDSDCCDSAHVCREAVGFFYNRCLYPSSAYILMPGSHMTMVASLLLVTFSLKWMLDLNWFHGEG